MESPAFRLSDDGSSVENDFNEMVNGDIIKLKSIHDKCDETLNKGNSSDGSDYGPPSPSTQTKVGESSEKEDVSSDEGNSSKNYESTVCENVVKELNEAVRLKSLESNTSVEKDSNQTKSRYDTIPEKEEITGKNESSEKKEIIVTEKEEKEEIIEITGKKDQNAVDEGILKKEEIMKNEEIHNQSINTFLSSGNDKKSSQNDENSSENDKGPSSEKKRRTSYLYYDNSLPEWPIDRFGIDRSKIFRDPIVGTDEEREQVKNWLKTGLCPLGTRCYYNQPRQDLLVETVGNTEVKYEKKIFQEGAQYQGTTDQLNVDYRYDRAPYMLHTGLTSLTAMASWINLPDGTKFAADSKLPS